MLQKNKTTRTDLRFHHHHHHHHHHHRSSFQSLERRSSKFDLVGPGLIDFSPCRWRIRRDLLIWHIPCLYQMIRGPLSRLRIFFRLSFSRRFLFSSSLIYISGDWQREIGLLSVILMTYGQKENPKVIFWW